MGELFFCFQLNLKSNPQIYEARDLFKIQTGEHLETAGTINKLRLVY